MPNQFIILPATTKALSYGADNADPWSIYWVHFSGKEINNFNQSFSISNYNVPTSIHFNEKGLKLWEEMYQCLEMGYSFDNLLYTNLLLCNFVATFLFADKTTQLQKNEESNDLITKSILLMREKLHEKLTTEEISHHFNISPSHFNVLFKKSTGIPPIEYFIHLKLQTACRQLDLSNKRIKEIADSVGYDDPYHFSRIFKKHIGQSPEQYRLSKKG